MTFYFYDLETSGFNPRKARIMQFAGQRTDMDLKPIGKPDNIFVKLTEDILPDPDAVMVTGITPQQTHAEGITEAEFLKYLMDQVFTPGTLAVGYNNIRFDDEFMRFTLWRNFYDAYEWQWRDGRGRWDLLDVARMTRALRPSGIKWSFASDGKPSNRLEDLSAVNKLEHVSAHDALSDVKAVIALAKLIKAKQPKLFSYLLGLRDKREVSGLVNSRQPFVYTSSRYPSEYEKTTVVVMVAPDSNKNGALVYDLRIDPARFIDLSPEKLAELWSLHGRDVPYFPVKSLAYNRCPAVAPLSVLDEASQKRLELNMPDIAKNASHLKKAEDFGDKLAAAQEIMKPKAQTGLVADQQKVEGQLYDGFVGEADKTKMRVLRAADSDKLAELNLDFSDERLKLLLPLYKARNYPASLSAEERSQWEEYKSHKLLDGGQNSLAALYFKRLDELGSSGLTKDKEYLLEELKLYGQSILPEV